MPSLATRSRAARCTNLRFSPAMYAHAGDGLDHRLADRPVDREVVLAAEPVVVDPGRVRHVDVRPRAVPSSSTVSSLRSLDTIVPPGGVKEAGPVRDCAAPYLAHGCHDTRAALANVGGVRIATWNVNSVKQRVPRFLPWLDERQPDVRVPPGDQARRRRVRRAARRRADRARLRVRPHGEAQWNGVAILSRVGLDDVVRGVAGRARLPATRRRGRSPRRAAGSGSTRCTCRTGASPTPTTTSTSWPGWPRCATVVGGRPGGGDRVRRHEHRADRRRRVRPGRRTSGRPTSRRRSGRRWPTCRRSACTTSCASAGRPSGSSPTGTTGPACSTRTSACASTWCSPAAPVAERVRAAWVDRHARKGTGPSDHAPVIVDLDEAPDGDIGPVVPPPSGTGAEARLQAAPGPLNPPFFRGVAGDAHIPRPPHDRLRARVREERVRGWVWGVLLGRLGRLSESIHWKSTQDPNQTPQFRLRP